MASNIILEKNQSVWRWAILVLGCLMMVGSYYCFDIPAALKTQIDDYMGDPSDYEIQFGLLYTLYSAPNVILPFFGGYLVDRIGVRMCLLLFASLITVGQVIFALGLSLKSWPVMLVGRLIFGFGGESFTVANSALLAQWFKGKELAFAFGVNLSISKLGSVVNNLVSPILTDDINILFALWFGAILCGFCVGCVMVAIPIDVAVEALIKQNVKDAYHEQHALADQKALFAVNDDTASVENPVLGVENGGSSNVASSVEPSKATPADEADLRDVFRLKYIFWILVVSCMVVYGCVLPFNNISSSLLLERDYFKAVPSSCTILYPEYCENDASNPYISCPASEWYQPPLPLNATVDNTVYNPLDSSDIDCTKSSWKDNCATSLYCDRLTSAESKASVIMSIPYIISACLSPPLGYVIDLYGFRAVIAAVAPAILIIVHMLLGFATSVDPVGPLVGQGLAYTGFVSVLWPSVPLVVREREIGLAFGVVTSAQNLATAIIPLITASIYSDSGEKYVPYVELLFVILAAIGFIVGLYMNVYDWQHGHALNGEHWVRFLQRVASAFGLRLRGLEYVATAGSEEHADALLGDKTKPLLEEDTERPPRSREPSTASASGRKLSAAGAGTATLVPYPPLSASFSESQEEYERTRQSSRGGSFTTYEEAMRGGAFRSSKKK